MNTKQYHLEKYKSDNGLRILTVPIERRRAASIGFWVLTGSAYELPEFQGISHFVEHIVFRGTENYSGKEIVAIIEKLGGSIDAYTSKEETCYYATVLGEDIETAVKILSDLVSRPLFDRKDVELERSVVLSEIDDWFDDHSSLAQDLFMKVFFGDLPLGNPILGSKHSVSEIGLKDLKDYWLKNYSDGNILIGAAGAVDGERFVELVRENLSERVSREKYFHPKVDRKENNNGKLVIVPKKSPQVHFFIGGRTFPFVDNRRYALAVLDALMGRGSASRLFQIIREKMGLVYNIQSFNEFYTDAGFWAVYAGTSPKKFTKLFDEILKQFDIIRKNRVGPSELDDAKNFLRGRLLLSSENIWTILNRAVECERYLGRFVSIEETIEKIMNITSDDIIELADEILRNENLVAFAFGDIDASKIRNENFDIVEKSVQDILDL